MNKYKYKIELHSHTAPASSCAIITPRELVTALKEKGYDAVVLTNHFFSYDHKYAQYQRADNPVEFYLNDFYEAKRVGEELGVKVLLGAEYCLDGGNDYLVYGISEEFLQKTVMLRDMDLEKFYNEFHRDDLLFIQAHPFREGNFPAPKEFLDGIEVMNNKPDQDSQNDLAIKLAEEYNLPIKIVGSDVHQINHVGTSAIRTRILPKDEKHLVQILKSNDYIFEINEKEPE